MSTMYAPDDMIYNNKGGLVLLSPLYYPFAIKLLEVCDEHIVGTLYGSKNEISIPLMKYLDGECISSQRIILLLASNTSQ